MASVSESSAIMSVEELLRLSQLMNKKYGGLIRDRSFSCHASRNGDVIEATVTLANKDRSYCYPVEGRLMLSSNSLEPVAAALFLIDYIDVYFDEYLRDGGDALLPIDWADFEHDGVGLQVRGQVLNLKLEAEADRLLELGKKPDEDELPN